MPNHIHGVNAAIPYLRENATGVDFPVSKHGARVWINSTSINTGGMAGKSNQVADPHNNMPPYIALYHCKKNMEAKAVE